MTASTAPKEPDQLAKEIIVQYGPPPVPYTKRDLTQDEQRTFSGYSYIAHEWPEQSNESSTVTLIVASSKATPGKYWLLPFKYNGSGDLNSITPYTSMIIAAYDYNPETGELVAELPPEVEKPNATLSIRLVQGSKKSSQVSKPFAAKMLYSFEKGFQPQNTTTPLRMEFWVKDAA